MSDLSLHKRDKLNLEPETPPRSSISVSNCLSVCLGRPRKICRFVFPRVGVVKSSRSESMSSSLSAFEYETRRATRRVGVRDEGR